MSWLDQVHPSWNEILSVHELFIEETEESLAVSSICPPRELILRAFSYPLGDTKIAIFGQDPYPDIANACGLAFSVPTSDWPLPPSLANIFRELHEDIGGESRTDGDLSDWTRQGVALINRVLTVPEGKSGGHRNIGWQRVTDSVAETLGEMGCIAILWGNFARELEKYFPIESRISSAHPSPLSAYKGFYGSRPFSKANQLLVSQGEQVIDWLGNLK